MNAVGEGWEELLVSLGNNLSPRASIFMAGLNCDELVIIGGQGKRGYMGDGFILDIANERL